MVLVPVVLPRFRNINFVVCHLSTSMFYLKPGDFASLYMLVPLILHQGFQCHYFSDFVSEHLIDFASIAALTRSHTRLQLRLFTSQLNVDVGGF